MYGDEYRDVALLEVENSNNDWISYDGVRENLREKGFTVIEVETNDYYSNLFYSRDGKIKIINIKEDIIEKKKYENLLQLYCLYAVREDAGFGFVSINNDKYDKAIKSPAKKLYKQIKDLSADKEFGEVEMKVMKKVK